MPSVFVMRAQVATTTFTDNFNRANSTTSIGGAWSVIADQNATGTGTPTWGIISNTTYPTGDVIDGTSTRHRPVAYQDFGAADIDITVTLSTYYAAGSNKSGGIALRLGTDGSLFFVGQDQVRWLGPTSGASTVFSYTGPNFTTGDVMRVVAVGSSITVYRNGTIIGSGTSTNNLTATRHGLGAGALFDANMRFDDFIATY